MSASPQNLTLYRGIYTDSYHADIIKNQGFEQKWAIEQESKRYSPKEIDEFLKKDSLKLDDVSATDMIKSIYFASATERDACFYALWNKKGGYIGNYDLKQNEQYYGPKSPYIIKFKVSPECVGIDASDSLYPMSYQPEKWEGENYDKLCMLFSKRIVDKYKPYLLSDKYDDNALVALMSSEPEAILSFYKNKDILINGKRGIQMLSAFKVFTDITKENIISVKETSEEECRNIIDSFKPKAEIQHWFS